MTMNPLPPQAYTKETMVKAYQWLQHQTDNIKEMATNPDILVSLYLKAKMQGDSALDRPSIQNFKNELKNLAGMMGEFEVVETPHHIPPTPPAFMQSAPAPQPQPIPQFQQPLPPPPQPAPAYQPPQPQMAAPAPPQPPSSSVAMKRPMPELDTRSWLMIQEVKNHLNLSSEQEALRVLISVGHSKVKSLMSEK